MRYTRLPVTFSSRTACGNVALREATMHTCTRMDVQTHGIMLNRRCVSDTHVLKRARAAREIGRFFSQPDDRRRGYVVFRAVLEVSFYAQKPRRDLKLLSTYSHTTYTAAYLLSD